MRLVKLITPKKTKTLHCFSLAILVLFFTASNPVFSQDNSPYSRYGIGDIVPNTNILTRGMGGISAAYTDFLSINFSNPASFASFQSLVEAKSKKIVSGRAVLDVGMNFESRTLQESSPARKFTASNALFSYLNIGVPLKPNLGMSFGLRPVSRVSYKIFRNERLKDPLTGQPIDSALTRYEGEGGSYLASIGLGYALLSKKKAYGLEEKLSVGANTGYLFGKKDYSTKRSLINDTVLYYQANYQNRTTYGNLWIDVGMQYQVPIDTASRITLAIGAFGNWGQKMDASQDILRETFAYDNNLGDLRLDSVSDMRDVKGKIIMPASFTIGFALQKPVIMEKNRRESGWLLGMDFSIQNWSKYRFYGQTDSVRNKWELRVGGQFTPFPKKNYFSNVTYRAGFFVGPDYIKVGKNLPQIGGSFGLGLPIAVNRQAPNQFTIINMAFEYGRRGNSSNLLRESLFRFSLGFSFSDIWFGKRKYD